MILTNELVRTLSFTLVFSTFNAIILLLYYIYGAVLYLQKGKRTSHSGLSEEQTDYLNQIKFINVQRKWIKEITKKIKLGSVLYFIFAELICFVAILYTEEYVLICRIALFTDIFLLLCWVVLLVYVNKKDTVLAIQHQENREKALEEFKKSKNTEQEA